jgi:copper chaperone
MIELVVEKMKCEGCSANVEKAVKAEDGDAIVKIDLTSKQVLVESALPAAVLTKIISDVGYPALVKSS